MLKIITVTNNFEATIPLINSLEKLGWDYHVIETEWKGFGTKLIKTYEYLKQNPQITEFIFCDAFDVISLGNEEEFLMKKQAHFGDADCIFSAEKGCWPDGSLAEKYPPTDGVFKYLNSGLYYCKTNVFLKILEENPISYIDDDQLYFTKCYLNGFYPNSFINAKKTYLDFNQSIFNSHSFIDPDEYGYENNRVQILGNEPIFLHFNGKTIDEKFTEMIKL